MPGYASSWLDRCGDLGCDGSCHSVASLNEHVEAGIVRVFRVHSHVAFESLKPLYDVFKTGSQVIALLHQEGNLTGHRDAKLPPHDFGVLHRDFRGALGGDLREPYPAIDARKRHAGGL